MKKFYFNKFMSEMENAEKKKQFRAMGEIFEEMKRLNGVEHGKTNIFFSELNKDLSIILPYKFRELKNKNRIGSFVYTKDKCLYIDFFNTVLKKWQKDYMKKAFSAYYEELSVVEEDKIFINKEIQDILGLEYGDVIIMKISDGIVISKFRKEDCIF